METSIAAQSTGNYKNIFLVAVWFGLVTGLGEGISLWILNKLDWLAGQITYLGSSYEILWITPLFDLIVFGILGLILIIIARIFPRLPVAWFATLSFAFLAFFDWLAIPLIGRINILAIVVLALGLATQFTRWFHRHERASLRFLSRSIRVVVGLAGLALVGIQGGAWLWEQIAIRSLPPSAPGSPNILVVVVDTLRADHLSSYGYARNTSPTIDRLAQQGVLFENAFAASSWTQPSHASLLTGRYPHEHGADDFVPLDNRWPTIAETLQSYGYRAGAFSANVDTFNRSLGFGRGFHRFEDQYRSLDNIIFNTLYGRVIEYYVLHRGLGLDYKLGRMLASDINRSVLRWIDQNQDVPFFAFLNYYDVHAPYRPPQPYRGMFSEFEEPGGLINTDWGMDQIYLGLSPAQIQGEIDAYDGAITYVDDHIGQLLAELQDRGLLENTLVVVTSDHGESFGEHGLFEHHNSLYPEVIQVPLVVWRPGYVPQGLRIATPVSNAALPATLLDLVDEGLAQNPFPGPSLASLWKDPGVEPDWPYPLAEVAKVWWIPVQHLPFHGAMKSVINSEWQYIVHEEFGEELYNRLSDPEEARNLAGNQERRVVVDYFRTYLARVLADSGRLPNEESIGFRRWP